MSDLSDERVNEDRMAAILCRCKTNLQMQPGVDVVDYRGILGGDVPDLIADLRDARAELARVKGERDAACAERHRIAAEAAAMSLEIEGLRRDLDTAVTVAELNMGECDALRARTEAAESALAARAPARGEGEVSNG